MSRPLISIVVPTFNRERILSRTLPSLLDQKDAGAEYEVIVVVDGSTDGTLRLLGGRDWGPRLRFVSQPNRGLASARNRGAGEARGELVLFLDDDMIAAEDLVSVHLQEHGASRALLVLGQMGLADGVRRSFLKQGVEDWGREFAARVSSPGYRFGFGDIHFGHASIPRSLFLELGRFDESFVAFGNEDYDLGWRLLQRGVEPRFAPRAQALQIYDKTFFRWLSDVKSVGRADVVLSAKHPSITSDLRLSRRETHPLKRMARWSGLAARDPLAPAWTGLAFCLSAAERLALRGGVLGHAQSLLGEREYWRGVRDARRPRAVAGAASLKRAGRAA